MSFPTRHRTTNLQVSSSTFLKTEHSATPSPTATTPPFTPQSSYSTSSEVSEDYNDHSSVQSCETPASGTSPARSSAASKRKRCRVTPDQLVHLERMFLTDRNPNASRRREISETLGMNERQTQVWFQNRRAKAKTQGGKLLTRRISETFASSEPSPSRTAEAVEQTQTYPQAGSTIYDFISEEQVIELIPCTELSIGTWRRIPTPPECNDLLAYICNSKECLSWFVMAAGNSFKMSLSFENIASLEFIRIATGGGLLNLDLWRPPTFYMQSVSETLSSLPQPRFWRQCTDWTEGAQATHVLRHELRGPIESLETLAGALKARISRSLSRPVITIPVVPQGTSLLNTSHYTHSPHELPLPPSPLSLEPEPPAIHVWAPHDQTLTSTAPGLEEAGPILCSPMVQAMNNSASAQTSTLYHDTPATHAPQPPLPRSFSAPVILPYYPDGTESPQLDQTQYARPATESPPLHFAAPSYFTQSSHVNYYDHNHHHNSSYQPVETVPYPSTSCNCEHHIDSFHQ
ncbi:hypothetical protein PM082_016165 [Marasmius tenuissimus]|nr:hypothetical protein PM082_016165 [Marasmius tenuissimus]